LLDPVPDCARADALRVTRIPRTDKTLTNLFI